LFILVVAFILMRRRRVRKHKGTIGADIMVVRQQDVELVTGKKEKEIEKEKIESSGNSTHSEPLPPYTPAGDVP